MIPVNLYFSCALPFYIVHEAAGASGTRHSLRPFRGGANEFLHNSGEIAPRDCGGVSHRHCEPTGRNDGLKRARAVTIGCDDGETVIRNDDDIELICQTLVCFANPSTKDIPRQRSGAGVARKTT